MFLSSSFCNSDSGSGDGYRAWDIASYEVNRSHQKGTSGLWGIWRGLFVLPCYPGPSGVEDRVYRSTSQRVSIQCAQHQTGYSPSSNLYHECSLFKESISNLEVQKKEENMKLVCFSDVQRDVLSITNYDSSVKKHAPISFLITSFSFRMKCRYIWNADVWHPFFRPEATHTFKGLLRISIIAMWDCMYALPFTVIRLALAA